MSLRSEEVKDSAVDRHQREACLCAVVVNVRMLRLRWECVEQCRRGKGTEGGDFERE